MKLTQLIKKAAFKAMILKAAKLCKGNIKTGKSILTWSKLYGNMQHFIDRLGISVKGSCKCKYCKGCRVSIQDLPLVLGNGKKRIPYSSPGTAHDMLGSA